jgi:hypothetical protein
MKRVLLTALLVLVALVVFVPPVQAGTIYCPNIPNPPGGYAACQGTENIDLIYGNAYRNSIVGLGGGDDIHGATGGDLLDGRAGPDLLRGGPGNDRLFGGGGNDSGNCGDGYDEFYGGDGYDTANRTDCEYIQLGPQ